MQLDGGALAGTLVIVAGFVIFFSSVAASLAGQSRGRLPSHHEARRRLGGFAVVFVGAALVVATRPMDLAFAAAMPMLVLAGLTVLLAFAIRSPREGRDENR